MLKRFLPAAMVLFVSGSFLIGGASAQDVALADPAVATPGIASVYDPCETVSENPSIADAQSGICVTGAANFIAGLASEDPAVADQAIADAVAQIAPLATAGANSACDKFDDEIAAAIRILANRSSSPDQAASLNEIASTIADCAPGVTAAVNPATPA